MTMGSERTRDGRNSRNTLGAARGIGQQNDYLYVIAGGKFYRLSPSQVKNSANEMDAKNPSPADAPIIRALQNLKDLNCPVADLQAPGPQSASCACIALNIDVFDGELQTLSKDE
jgi:hypothetical protein